MAPSPLPPTLAPPCLPRRGFLLGNYILDSLRAFPLWGRWRDRPATGGGGGASGRLGTVLAGLSRAAPIAIYASLRSGHSLALRYQRGR